MSETFDLQAFQVKHDAAIKFSKYWTCTTVELLAAYAAGERDFRRVKLEGANLRGAILGGAKLVDANLRGANLEDANLYDANLEGANLEDAYLEGAYLRGANLYGANLNDANLRGAILESAILVGAILEGANLEGAILNDANLYDANLYGANLVDAILEGAYLNGARGVGAIQNIGSRHSPLTYNSRDGLMWLRADDFAGTLEQFKAAVAKKPEGDPYRAEYEALFPFLDYWQRTYCTPSEAK